MNRVPSRPTIYHITHVDNLDSILHDGGLWSYATMLVRRGSPASIGMMGIKRRRLSLPVRCHAGDRVGDYVPFYFCPRSIMLFLIYRGNHDELTYRGGQGPIVHLEADLHATVAWAKGNDYRWAFSLSNAGAAYSEFRNQLDQLGDINWTAVATTDFRDPVIKDGKQAEFLIHTFFPWTLVRRIGVISEATRQRVLRALDGTAHRPIVEIRPKWYY